MDEQEFRRKALDEGYSEPEIHDVESSSGKGNAHP